jgi:hypothetical protein
MSAQAWGGAWAPRFVIARVVQMIGWSGMAGIALLVASALVFAIAWHANEEPSIADEAAVERPRLVPLAVVDDAAQLSLPDMPAASDVPQLIGQFERAAVRNGLQWKSAEYRLVSSTVTLPGSLEVRCAITGAYPQLRGMLVQLRQTMPSLSIRDFSASRANAETPDVEAKLVLAVFLRDAVAASVSSTAVAR